MKFHSFITDLLFFLLILALLIASVCFSFINQNQAFSTWNFPASQITCGLFALFIYIFYKDCKSEKKINSTKFLLTKIFPGLFSLCCLFFSALIFKALTFVVKNSFWIGEQTVVLPQSFLEYVYCITGFIFAAFYEEILYRFYFPEILKNFIFKKMNKTVSIILSEILALIIFSSAHIYLGGFAFINAIIGHSVLRLCLIKSKSVWPGFIAHFIYNCLVLFLL